MLVTGPALRRGKAKIWMTENKKPPAASADQKMSLCEPRRLGEKAETESCLTCVTEPALCGRRSPCIGLVGGPPANPCFFWRASTVTRSSSGANWTTANLISAPSVSESTQFDVNLDFFSMLATAAPGPRGQQPLWLAPRGYGRRWHWIRGFIVSRHLQRFL